MLDFPCKISNVDHPVSKVSILAFVHSFFSDLCLQILFYSLTDLLAGLITHSSSYHHTFIFLFLFFSPHPPPPSPLLLPSPPLSPFLGHSIIKMPRQIDDLQPDHPTRGFASNHDAKASSLFSCFLPYAPSLSIFYLLLLFMLLSKISLLAIV